MNFSLKYFQASLVKKELNHKSVDIMYTSYIYVDIDVWMSHKKGSPVLILCQFNHHVDR